MFIISNWRFNFSAALPPLASLKFKAAALGGVQLYEL